MEEAAQPLGCHCKSDGEKLSKVLSWLLRLATANGQYWREWRLKPCVSGEGWAGVNAAARRRDGGGARRAGSAKAPRACRDASSTSSSR
eukprot:1967106-Pyramimonas_sp.AAC.1